MLPAISTISQTNVCLISASAFNGRFRQNLFCFKPSGKSIKTQGYQSEFAGFITKNTAFIFVELPLFMEDFIFSFISLLLSISTEMK